jgi:DNA-binding GntR family transcriptional regulator
MVNAMDGDESMNKQAAEMAHRIERAVKSGKLTLDGSYTIPALAAAIGTTRAHLRQAVNSEFGSITSFCRGLGFSLRARG